MDDDATILDETVARVVGMDSAIFSRFLKMEFWPWLLVTREQAMNMRGKFRRAHTCCLDAWFSEWFVQLLPHVDAFDEEWCQSLLRELYRNMPSTNMPLENLLATVKASVPHVHQKVAAEKLVYAGHLSSIMRKHTSRKPANAVEIAERLG